jgi:hypothetical protein
VQEYIGARDAESIVQYLKKQVGSTASTEIKSAEDAPSSITDNNGNGKGKATVSSAAVDHSSASKAILGGSCTSILAHIYVTSLKFELTRELLFGTLLSRQFFS